MLVVLGNTSFFNVLSYIVNYVFFLQPAIVGFTHLFHHLLYLPTSAYVNHNENNLKSQGTHFIHIFHFISSTKNKDSQYLFFQN